MDASRRHICATHHPTPWIENVEKGHEEVNMNARIEREHKTTNSRCP